MGGVIQVDRRKGWWEIWVSAEFIYLNVQIVCNAISQNIGIGNISILNKNKSDMKSYH